MYYALDEDNHQAFFRANADLYGSYEQHESGKIIGGDLSVSRKKAFYNLFQSLLPYVEFPSLEQPEEKPKEKTPEEDAQDRSKMLSEMQAFVQQLGEVAKVAPLLTPK